MEYQTIDLSLIPSEMTQLQSHIHEKFLLFSQNENWNGEVMLMGENADFITNLQVFAVLRRKCTEIVYKANEKSSGLIVFSIYEEGQVLRQSSIREMKWLSSEEKKQLKENRGKSLKEEGVFDIEAFSKKVSETQSEDKISAALIFLIEQMKEADSLRLTGRISLEVAFIALNYLLATRKTVTWNDVKLK